MNPRAFRLDHRPHGLEVAVEEQRVQLAGRGGFLAELEQIRVASILALQSQRRGRMGEMNTSTTEPVHWFRARCGRSTSDKSLVRGMEPLLNKSSNEDMENFAATKTEKISSLGASA